MTDWTVRSRACGLPLSMIESLVRPMDEWPFYYDPTFENWTFSFDGNCTDLTIEKPKHGSKHASLNGEKPGPLFNILMRRYGIPADEEHRCTLEEYQGFKDGSTKYTFAYDNQPVERGWSGDLLIEGRRAVEVEQKAQQRYNNPKDPFLDMAANKAFWDSWR